MREGPQPGLHVRRGRRTRLDIRRHRLAIVLLLAALVSVTVFHVVRRPARPGAAQAYAAGRAALRTSNYSAARNHFLAAIDARPADGTAQVELARTYLLLGDGVAATGALERAVTAGIPAERLHVLRAAALLLQDDPDAAIAEAARATGSDAGEARVVGARALAIKGDRAGAAGALDALTIARPDHAVAWRELGRVRLELGDVGGAWIAAARANAADPDDLSTLTLRGDLVRLRYGLVAALPWYEAALARDAYFVPALLARAATLGDIGRYRDSLSDIRKTLAARPDEPRALYLAAVIAARGGDRELAARLLDRTGDAVRDVPGALLLSGGLDYAAGRYEQAVVKWRLLVERQPMNLAARRLLGAALLRLGDAAGTLAVLRPVALRADADGYTLGLVARAFEAQGQRGWAARFLDRAAATGAASSRPFGQDEDVATLAATASAIPDDPRAAVALIRGRLERGEAEAAMAQAERLAGAAPGSPTAQQVAGDVLFVLGRIGAAATAYERAANLRFDRPAMLRLLEARDRTGDRAGAAEVLALYLSQNPQASDARRALAGAQLAAGEGDAATTLAALVHDLGAGDALLLAQASRTVTGTDALSLARAAYRLQPMGIAAVTSYARALADNGDADGARQLSAKARALVER